MTHSALNTGSPSLKERSDQTSTLAGRSDGDMSSHGANASGATQHDAQGVDDISHVVDEGPSWPQLSVSGDGDPWQKTFLLSFDGGGVRGYSTLLILRELMSIVGRLEVDNLPPADCSLHPRDYVLPKGSHPHLGSDSFRYLPCHYFDYMAGTSTGGLIAIMLSRLRMTVDDCLTEYETFGEMVFGHSRWWSVRGPLPAFRDKYNSQRIVDAVDDVVRRRNPSANNHIVVTLRSAPDLCRTMVFAYRKTDEADNLKPYLFRSYEHLTRDRFTPCVLNAGAADEISLTDVAKATTAAPTYFEHHVINKDAFLDGGFGANNPTGHAHSEVLQISDGVADTFALAVSIGTGKSKKTSRFGQGLFGKYWSYWKFAKKMASDCEGVHMEMERSLQTFQGPKEHRPYFRLNVDHGLENMKLDEWQNKGWLGRRRDVNKTLEHIKQVTADYLTKPETRGVLEIIATRLVQNRRARSNTKQWARVCSGIRWRCNQAPCGAEAYQSAEGLERHLSHCHADRGFASDAQATEEQRRRMKSTINDCEIPS